MTATAMHCFQVRTQRLEAELAESKATLKYLQSGRSASQEHQDVMQTPQTPVPSAVLIPWQVGCTA